MMVSGRIERLPDHSTFSHAQTKRFADSSAFERRLSQGDTFSQTTCRFPC
jgi:hypothetical protein